LPTVTIIGNKTLNQKHIIKATRDAIFRQTIIAIIILSLNILFGALIFAYHESWSFGEGLYFSYCSILTIGFGDYYLKSFISKTIFIWFIFLAIGSCTYLISMISELAFDSWKVTEESIAKRVDRYETKARWKKRYGSPSGLSASGDESERPRAYSISLMPSNRLLGRGKGENAPLLQQQDHGQSHSDED
jgi:Ion channel